MNKFVLFLVLCAILPALVGPLSVNVEASLASVEPTIWQALASQEQAEVLVVLREQADLSGALALKTKEEKGWYVYRQLTETAERTQPALRAYLDRRGVEYRSYWICNVIRVWTDDPALIRALAGRPEVARVDYYHPAELDSVVPDAPSTENRLDAVEWNIQRVRADDVWALGYTGQGVVVGVIDSGIDWDHPALVDAYRPWVPGAPTRHDYNWYDGPGGSQVPVDYSGHGTVVSGIIVGDDGAGNQIGMAPEAHWVACAMNGGDANAMDCLQFMLAPTKLDGSDPRPDLAPHVISNSWRARADYEEIIHTLYMAGIMFVKAAENEGPDCGTVIPPGHLPEVTTVGAFARGDVMTSFSSFGPMRYNGQPIVKPNVTAPGLDCRTSSNGGGYTSGRGTSVACPHVAGAVALILSARPDLAGRVDTLQMILQESAEPMVDLQCPPNDPSGVPNNVWGYGILNAYDAVLLAQSLGMGDIQGQVSDSGTPQPIAEAKVSFEDAAGRSLLGTDVVGGVYAHTLPAATYTVTVETYGYYPGVVSDVPVISGGLTIQDVSLTARPAYVISGTVSAAGSGDPLSATVTVLHTPLPPIQSDPATGFYSLTLAEDSHTLRVESFQSLSKERLVVADGDQIQNFGLDPIPYAPYAGNPVLTLGAGGAWDSQSIVAPSAVYVDGTYYLFYLGSGPGNIGAIGYATSSDGIHFEKYAGNPILTGDGGGFDADYAGYPAVLVEDGTWTIYYAGWASGGQPQIGRATAPTPSGPWSRSYNPVLSPGSYWEWDGAQIYPDCVVGTDSGYALYYTGDSYPAVRYYIGMATSPDGLTWTKHNDPSTPNAPFAESDPVLHPGPPDDWDYRYILRGSVRQTDDGWEMFYGGFDPLLLSSAIGYATSPDGIHWSKEEHNPILHSKDEPMAEAFLANPSVVQGGLTDWLYYDGRNTYEDSWTQIGVATRTIYQPAVVVEPLALEANLYPHEQLTQTLWIGNVGNVDLIFQLDELSRTLAYDLPWLSENPISGTVVPGGGTSITVTFDSAGLGSGVYLGQLEVESNDPVTPYVSISVTLTVSPPPCAPVTGVLLSWEPITPTAGQVVTFTAEATGTQPVSYTWDLGDGNTGMDQVVTHSYAAAGSYAIILTATNPCGGQAVSRTITVTEALVCTQVSGVTLTQVTTGTIYAGDVVTFGADITPDDASTPYTYTVLLDGEEIIPPATSSDDPLPFSHTFPSTGTYTIEVATWNCQMTQAGAVTDSLQVTVYQPGVCVPLESVTILGPITGYLGQPYTFTLQYTPTGASLPISYTWDDGSTEASSSRTFDVTGSHTLSVTAANCDRTPVEDEHVIVIEEAPSCVELDRVGLTLLNTGTLYLGDTANFIADLFPDEATKPYSCTLGYGDGSAPVSGSSSDDPFSLSHIYTATGTYTVAFEAWNCEMVRPVSDTVQVVVSRPGPEDYAIYLPVVIRDS